MNGHSDQEPSDKPIQIGKKTGVEDICAYGFDLLSFMASGNDGWDLWWAMEGQARVEDVVGSNGFNVVCEAHKATTVILSEHVEAGLENRCASWLHLGS